MYDSHLEVPTEALLQSLDDGLVGLYADLYLRPGHLVRGCPEVNLGLLKVRFGRLGKDAAAFKLQ